MFPRYSNIEFHCYVSQHYVTHWGHLFSSLSCCVIQASGELAKDLWWCLCISIPSLCDVTCNDKTLLLINGSFFNRLLAHKVVLVWRHLQHQSLHLLGLACFSQGYLTWRQTQVHLPTWCQVHQGWLLECLLEWMILWNPTCLHNLEEWVVQAQLGMVLAQLVGWGSQHHLLHNYSIHLWQHRATWVTLTLLKANQADLLPHPLCQDQWGIYHLRCPFSLTHYPWANTWYRRINNNLNNTWCSRDRCSSDKEHLSRSVDVQHQTSPYNLVISQGRQVTQIRKATCYQIHINGDW